MGEKLDKGYYGEQTMGFWFGERGYIIVDGPSGAGGHAANASGLDGCAFKPSTRHIVLYDNKALRASGNISTKSGITIDPRGRLIPSLEDLINRVRSIRSMPGQADLLTDLQSTLTAVRAGRPWPTNVQIALTNAISNKTGITAELQARGITFIDVNQAPSLVRAIETGSAVKISGLRTAGRFFAREVPNLALQAVLMLLFPPGVKIRNDKAEELNRTKLDPAIQDVLAKQDAKISELLNVENPPSIYANVTANLDYSVAATGSGDLVLTLQDASVLDVKVSYDDVTAAGPRDSKFAQTGSLKVTKKVTYSMVLYEPPWVTRERAQKGYESPAEKMGREAAQRRFEQTHGRF